MSFRDAGKQVFKIITFLNLFLENNASDFSFIFDRYRIDLNSWQQLANLHLCGTGS